jgi:hypothetical protein
MAISARLSSGCVITANGGGYVSVFIDSNSLESVTATLLLNGVGFSGAKSANTVWGGSKYSAFIRFDNVQDGNYTVDVQGVNSGNDVTWDGSDETLVFCSGCDIAGTATATATDINGTGTGQVTIAATTSHPPLLYAFGNTTNWVTDPVFSGIAAGNHIFYIKDAVNCLISRTATVLAGECTIALVTLSTTNESVPDASDGTVTSTVTGANGSITYSLDNSTYVASPLFDNLAPGNYTYYAKDSAGCITSQAFTIGEKNTSFTPVTAEYLLDERMTISYQPELGSFTAFHSYVPNHYISRGNKVFMTRNDLSTIWELNKGLKGVYFDQSPEQFSITFVINPFPSVSKVYDNFVLITNTKNGGKEIYNATFNKLQVWNLYQNSGEVTLVIGRQQVIDISNRLTHTKAELVNNEFRISVPRNVVADALGDIFNPDNLVTSSLFESTPDARKFRDQMRDKFLVVKLTYDNVTNYELDLVGLKSIFRAIAR